MKKVTAADKLKTIGKPFDKMQRKKRSLFFEGLLILCNPLP